MKKITVIVLSIALALSIGACSKEESPETSTETPSSSSSSPSIATTSPSTASESPSAGSSTPSASASKLKDGTYDEKGDPWAQGQEEAIIIIKDGKISHVALIRLDKAGKEIDYSKFDGKEHEGKLYPNLKEFKETLAAKIKELQSAQIDTISGATVSTGNWKVAAQKALDKSKKEKEKEEKEKEEKKK